MQNIKIEQTSDTPSIDFNFVQGIFEIQGVSYPEYAKDFYEPVLTNLKNYVQQPPTERTVMFFKFNYFNTGTNSLITKILKELEKLVLQDHLVEVLWYYEEQDEDIKELGTYFKTLTSLSVKFVPCKHL